MSGRAFVVVKEVFHHRNDILTLWEWLNFEKWFSVNYNSTYVYLGKKFDHLHWVMLTRAILSPNMYWWAIVTSSWLHNCFEPTRWLVLGHVTGINSAITTNQPQPANHDLGASLAFELIKKKYFILFQNFYSYVLLKF